MHKKALQIKGWHLPLIFSARTARFRVIRAYRTTLSCTASGKAAMYSTIVAKSS
jgi:hypothetical protein